MKRHCFILSLVLLFSCSNDSNFPLSASSGTIDVELDYELSANLARQLYTGSRVENPLSQESAAYTITTFNSGFFPNSDLVSNSSIEGPEWTATSITSLLKLPYFNLQDTFKKSSLPYNNVYCYFSGSITARLLSINENNQYSYNVDYDDCQLDRDTPRFNGNLDITFELEEISENFPIRYVGAEEIYYKFNNLHVSYNSFEIMSGERNVVIDGGILWTNTFACNEPGLMTLTARILDKATGDEILLDDMKLGIRMIYPNAIYCYLPESRGGFHPRFTYIRGNTYSSRYGSIYIETPSIHYEEGFDPFSWFTSLPANYDFFNLAELKLESANTKALFQDRRVESIFLKINQRKLSLWIYDINGVRTHATDMAASMFANGGMLNLNDDDKDGMGNTWETAAGLDPQDGGDGHLDLDNDGTTNLDEFQFAGDPTESTHTGIKVDIGFSPQSRAKIGYQGDNDIIEVRLVVDGKWYFTGSTERYITITTDTDGEWLPQNPICTILENRRTIVCPSRSLTGFVGGFIPATDGIVTFAAELAVVDTDYYPENNFTKYSVIYP